ncbi:hypothetical protein [Nocardia sp. AB354]|uniref:hypothetical protein n=1 Tax=Nocardia sp. AB354 TaxID=3413283 RepID=UPI003C220D91
MAGRDPGTISAEANRTPRCVGLIMTLQVYAQPGESYPAAVDRVLAIVFDGLSSTRRTAHDIPGSEA